MGHFRSSAWVDLQLPFPPSSLFVFFFWLLSHNKGPSRIIIIFIYDNYYHKRGRGSKNDGDYHNFLFNEKSDTVLVIYCPFRQLSDCCLRVIEQLYNLKFLCYLLFLMAEKHDIIVSGGGRGSDSYDSNYHR